MAQHRQILKSASVIGFFTLISRILGYVRDARLTLLLGTAVSADALLLAYRLPNLMRRIAVLRAIHFEGIVYCLPRLGAFLALLAGGTAVYFGLARVLGCRELGELYELISRSERGAPAVTGPLA
ncbi:MAG: hypothetical protein WBF35_07330 [Candidatus Acidiferrales bacterium]